MRPVTLILALSLWECQIYQNLNYSAIASTDAVNVADNYLMKLSNVLTACTSGLQVQISVRN